MKILFVCSGNAHRSPLAEALLKKSRPDLQVESAGLSVVIPVSSEVRRYLAGLKAEKYLKESPENLHTESLNEYDLIIAMQQQHKDVIASICPRCESKTIVWNIRDPYGLSSIEAERIYEQIRTKVKMLAESLYC